MRTSYLISFAILVNTVNCVTLETKFVEKAEFDELVTVLNNKLRNTLNEFYQMKKEDVQFLLLTRENQHPVLLNETNLYLINPNVTTVFIIGGWLQDGRIDLMYYNISRAYLQKGNYNTIIVDNHKVMFYPVEVSVSYIVPSGNIVGQFITHLQRLHNISLDTVHLVGHSMGGNIAAFAAREVTRLTGSKVHRITSLDASHHFNHLNRNDAHIVDAIHTSALVGLIDPIGTADFYPNSDDFKLQPGCTLYPKMPFNDLSDEISFVFCSHHSSTVYFIKTINSFHKAVKCGSFKEFQNGTCNNNEVAIFGDNYVAGPQGKFYLYLNCSESQCISRI